MRKTLDWAATEKRARAMSAEQLHYARLDCHKAAQCWSDPDSDPDGNFDFYRDEGSVYAKEQKRRSK